MDVSRWPASTAPSRVPTIAATTWPASLIGSSHLNVVLFHGGTVGVLALDEQQANRRGCHRYPKYDVHLLSEAPQRGYTNATRVRPDSLRPRRPRSENQ